MTCAILCVSAHIIKSVCFYLYLIFTTKFMCHPNAGRPAWGCSQCIHQPVGFSGTSTGKSHSVSHIVLEQWFWTIWNKLFHKSVALKTQLNNRPNNLLKPLYKHFCVTTASLNLNPLKYESDFQMMFIFKGHIHCFLVAVLTGVLRTVPPQFSLVFFCLFARTLDNLGSFLSLLLLRCALFCFP